MSNFDDYDNSDNPYAAPDLGGGYDRDLEPHGEQPLAGRLQRLGSQIGQLPHFTLGQYCWPGVLSPEHI